MHTDRDWIEKFVLCISKDKRKREREREREREESNNELPCLLLFV